MHELSSTATVPALPSPTLTNPDMILPYNQDYARMSTPSPPPELTRRPSPPLAARALNSHPPFAQLARPPSGRRTASPMVTPPLESYTAGGMLPDIEEVETTPKARGSKQSVWRRPDSQSPPLTSSPTLEFAPSRQNGDLVSTFSVTERRPSNSMSDGSSSHGFENFDDAFSVDEDGIFPDEDEEFSGSAGEDHGYHTHNGTEKGAAGTGATRQDERDGKVSHVALSRRAERILASAKRRLDNMEGNLSRARHSLIASPSPSMPTPQNSRYSPPSADVDAGGLLVRPPLGVSPAKHRQLHSASSSNGTPGHLRVSSETSVPSSLYSSPQSPLLVGRSTSAQAMVGTAHSPGDGSSPSITLSISKTRSDEYFNASKENGQIADFPKLGCGRSLSANYVRKPPESHSAPITPSLKDDTLQGHSRDLIFNNNFNRADRTLTNQSGINRSHSTAQMRDLRDQMKDLKGKISSLQQRAREDGLRRRSFQSLRTPSPFTAAEAWYTAANGYVEGGLSANAGVGMAERRYGMGFVGEEKIDDSEPGRGEPDIGQRVAGHYEDAGRKTNGVDGIGDPIGIDGGINGEDLRESPYDGDGETERFSTESPVDPELQPATVGERHEDRADAFDYEHFFLHSGMGNYELPGSRRQSRSLSCSSGGSTSTTKVTSQSTPEHQHQQSNGNWRRSVIIPRAERIEEDEDDDTGPKPFPKRYHARQDSVSSISTYATFATATEGRGSGENSEDEDVDEYRQGEIRQARTDGPQISTLKAAPGPSADTPTGTDDHQSWQEANSDRSSTPTTVRGANESPSNPREVAKTNGKVTPTSVSSEDRSASSTPVGTPRSFPLVNKPRQIFPRPLPSTRALLSGRSGRSGSLGAAGVYGSESPVILNKEDRALVEGLVETLKRACGHLSDADPQAAGDWRRRLEDARKLLEGAAGAGAGAGDDGDDDDWKTRRQLDGGPVLKAV
ncbi:hypothetical protein GP486_001033 [Trichoglossum hirsutum]|uniref:Uncharacterized protein n=1 Tax=Trichoglossum hirsutum TaxID=265104 RepID=A0A9P8LHU6_9PEZI|nr:hypothetical protein GP486_001033 [Trichoglossum hirsutum]